MAAEPLTVNDFARAARVETPGDAGLYRIRMPLELYRSVVRADMGDIRIFNDRGDVVPHAVQTSRRNLAVRPPGRHLPLFPLRGDPQTALNAVRITIQSQDGSVGVETRDAVPASGPTDTLAYIADARGAGGSVAALLVEWPEDSAEFAALLDVDVSDDLSGWVPVRQQASIVNLKAGDERLVQQRIEFPATRARYWRLAWSGGKPPEVRLSGVVAEPAAQRQSAAAETMTVAGTRVAGQAQEFLFDLGAPLPVDRVTLELPERNTVVTAEMSYRTRGDDPWRPAGRGGLYRLAADVGEIRNPPVPVNAAAARFWRVQIDPTGGGVGSGVPQLTAGWYPDEIIFAARGARPFTLAFGSATAVPSEVPVAALTSVAGPSRGGATIRIDDASLGTSLEAGGPSRLQPPPKPFPWKSVVLRMVLVVGAVALGFMAVRLAREMGKGPGDGAGGGS